MVGPRARLNNRLAGVGGDSYTAAMTEIVFYTASTLNGFIADERNSLEWLFAVDSSDGPDFEGFLQNIGVLVEGSTTYEWVLHHEKLLEQPQKWTELYGDRPTFVFTSRELPVPLGADVTFVTGAVQDALPRLLEAAGSRDVWVVGGGDLAGQFFDAGALTQIQVSVTPATLSGGAPLLPRDIGPDRLRLENVEKFGQFAHLTFGIRT